MKYSHKIKLVLSWLVFWAILFYGFVNFFQFLAFAFVLGSNDTALEILGGLALYLSPLPAALLSLRHRYLASICLLSAVTLWALGMLNGDAYIAQKFGTRYDPHKTLWFSVRTSAPLAFFAFFFGITELLGWPAIYPRKQEPEKKLA